MILFALSVLYMILDCSIWKYHLIIVRERIQSAIIRGQGGAIALVKKRIEVTEIKS